MDENPVFNQAELRRLGDPEIYLSALDCVINLLKSQNQVIINAFKQEVKKVVDREALHQLLIEAMSCLAETDFDTFLWALHHYDAEFYVAVKQQMNAAAVKRLIERGFIPGKDFSAMPSGGLAVHQVAEAVLLENPSTLSSQLLRDILQLFN